MVSTDQSERLRNAALAVIALGVILAGLIYGRGFLIPLAIAILLWNLLGAVIERFAQIRIGEFQLPRWVAALLGVAVVVLGLYVIQSILLGQVDAISVAWPRYMARLETIVGDLTQWLGAEQSAKLKQAIMSIDLTRRVAGVVSSAQSFVVSFLLILAYVGFLFVESAFMRQKIAAMFPDQARAREASAVLTAVSESVRRYIWIKTVVSTLTAVASYAVLRLLGIDFAATWALLIFLLNYIPNIGSIVAVSFPALVALVQFDTLGPFIVLVLGLTSHSNCRRQRVGAHADGPHAEYEPVRHHPFARLLGDDLGHRGHVSQRAHYGSGHDRVCAHPELALGGDPVVEGWPHRSLRVVH